MPGPEITPASRLGLLDPHVWITKGHALNFIAIHHIHDGLLFAVAGFTLGNAARLVKRNFATFVFSQLYLFSGSVAC